jgi:ankyrin repeat protein
MPRQWRATVRSSMRSWQARQTRTSSIGTAPLFWAAATGTLDATRRLLDHGANPNARDKRGNTALHGAADGGHLEVVLLLLSRKANPSVKNADGLTPADIARGRGYDQVVKALGTR